MLLRQCSEVPWVIPVHRDRLLDQLLDVAQGVPLVRRTKRHRQARRPGPAGPTLPSGGDWLGTDDGLGFGWEDINVYRLGAEYFYNQQWTWRAGFLYSDQVIPDDQVLFNILAPATVQKHLTLGFTWDLDESSSITGSYLHAFKSEVDGDFIAPTPQGPFNFGSGNLEMSQNAFGISYNKRF